MRKLVWLCREEQSRRQQAEDSRVLYKNPVRHWEASGSSGRYEIRTNDLRVIGSYPKDTPSECKKAPVWALFSSGGWIRTNDLRVMSSNPIWHTVDRRVICLGVARRSWVTKSPVHCI
jgi:hypothetical protein